MNRYIMFCIWVPIISFVLVSCSSYNNKQETPAAPVLLSDVNTKASCVFLAGDEQQLPVISWTEIDSKGNKRFLFSYWDKNVGNFGKAISVPIEENTSIHEEGMPKIAIKSNGAVIAIYETSVPSETSRFGLSDLKYRVSHDSGSTWTGPKSIQGLPQKGSRSFGNIARMDDGEIGAVWLGAPLDKQGSGRPVFFAKTNGEDGFGEALLIDSNACQCCRTALCSNGNGKITIIYRDLLPGSVRDISIATSADNGKTFSTPVSFSNDHWVIDGCPHNGPSVAGKHNQTYVTWFTGGNHQGAYYAVLDNSNSIQQRHRLDENSRYSQICVMPDATTMVVYNKYYRAADSVYSKIIMRRMNEDSAFEKEISSPKAFASYPVMLPLGNDTVITAWSDKGAVYYRIIGVKSVTRAVNKNAPTSLMNENLMPPGHHMEGMQHEGM